MSASSPPDPQSIAVTASATTTTTNSISNPAPRPIQPLLQPHHHLHNHRTLPPPQTHRQQQPIYRQPAANNPHHGILYPVASSGRGFLPKPPTPLADQTVTTANNSSGGGGGFPHRSIAPYPYPYPVRPFGYGSHSDPILHLIRPTGTTHLQQTLLGSTNPTVVKGFPVSTNPKVAPPPSSVSEGNGFKDLRDRSKDDTFVTVGDRKVKFSSGASLYAQCRSWVKNGLGEENQPQYVDCVRSLPKPFPVSVGDANLQVIKEDDTEEENEEDVEHLSAKELLQGHIKRAKKVRARLREERLQRIARYKGRLALLLPPVVEQQLKNDSAPGN